jgi:hypothetical protein
MVNATSTFGSTENYRKHRRSCCADLGSIHADADTQNFRAASEAVAALHDFFERFYSSPRLNSQSFRAQAADAERPHRSWLGPALGFTCCVELIRQSFQC